MSVRAALLHLDHHTQKRGWRHLHGCRQTPSSRPGQAAWGRLSRRREAAAPGLLRGRAASPGTPPSPQRASQGSGRAPTAKGHTGYPHRPPRRLPGFSREVTALPPPRGGPCRAGPAELAALRPRPAAPLGSGAGGGNGGAEPHRGRGQSPAG